VFAALFLPLLVIAVFGAIRFGGFFLKSDPGQPPVSAANAVIQKRLRLIGVCLLAVGLPVAGLIYLNAPADDEGGAIGYEIDGGTAVPIQPGDSKSYDRQMEGMGGGAAVLAAEFAAWWHGRKLAYTLAILSVAGSLLCFFLARLQGYLPPPENS
jgi:hypothetical protein